jgi:hypothetical protein
MITGDSSSISRKKDWPESMQIDGEWYVCDDGIIRPVVRGEVLASDGSWVPTPFLVDIGADCTVLAAAILALLHLRHGVARERLGGLGGVAHSVVVESQIRLSQSEGDKVVFRGQFAAVTSLEALDMSVLGRDITNLFAVIVDQPGDTVCLLRPRHRYSILRD